MKKVKLLVCLAAGIIVLTAVSASAKSVAAVNDSSTNSPTVTQPDQSVSSVLTVAKIVLGNTIGGFSATPMIVPEPSTLALVALGGVGLLASRRRK